MNYFKFQQKYKLQINFSMIKQQIVNKFYKAFKEHSNQPPLHIN